MPPQSKDPDNACVTHASTPFSTAFRYMHRNKGRENLRTKKIASIFFASETSLKTKNAQAKAQALSNN